MFGTFPVGKWPQTVASGDPTQIDLTTPEVPTVNLATPSALAPDGQSFRRLRVRRALRHAAGHLLIAVDAQRVDEHHGASLFCHGAVVGVPVVVRSPSGGEHLAQEQPQLLGVDVGP